MSKFKNSDKVIKITALLFGVLFSLAVIINFNKSLQTEEPKSETEKYYTEKKTQYDPSGNLIYVPENGSGTVSPSYDLQSEKDKYLLFSAATEKGYVQTNEDFNSDNSILARVKVSSSFPNVFSQKTEKKNTLCQTENSKGGFTYYEEQKDTDTPLLTPYYGYIIYTDATSKKLLSSKLHTLVEDFSGYMPAYQETLSANPLFVKDGCYYFYYNGSNYKGVVYEKITEKTFSSLTKKAPAGAYDYFSYNHDLLRNILAGAETENRALEDVVLTLSSGAGMVQYYPSSVGSNDRRIIRRTNNKSDYYSELIPFCYHNYTITEVNEWWDTEAKPKTEISDDDYAWGYLDKNGNVAIEPQYEMAYPFSPVGTAMIEDNGKIAFIDTSGKTVYNPYRITIDLPGVRSFYLRDGFYPREINSLDTVGMFFFDNGYSMVRRKIIDTANGYKVKSDENILISQFLETPNYPSDYNLTAYSDGIMLLEKNGYYGYMDTSGSWLVKPDLVYAEPFCEGLAVCAYEQGKIGMIDTKANTIISFCYTHIESASGGMITAYSPELEWNVFVKMSTATKATTTPDVRIEIIKRQIAQAKAEDYEIDKAKQQQGK